MQTQHPNHEKMTKIVVESMIDIMKLRGRHDEVAEMETYLQITEKINQWAIKHQQRYNQIQRNTHPIYRNIQKKYKLNSEEHKYILYIWSQCIKVIGTYENASTQELSALADAIYTCKETDTIYDNEIIEMSEDLIQAKIELCNKMGVYLCEVDQNGKITGYYFTVPVYAHKVDKKLL